MDIGGFLDAYNESWLKVSEIISDKIINELPENNPATNGYILSLIAARLMCYAEDSEAFDKCMDCAGRFHVDIIKYVCSILEEYENDQA